VRNWADLRKRALTAALLGPAAIACMWLGAEWWTALMALCMAGLSWEWVKLCGGSTRRLPGVVVPLAVLAAGASSVLGQTAIAFLLLGVGAVLAGGLATRRGVAPVWLGLGVLYVGVAGIALIELRHDDAAGRANVIFLFLVVWASDIGAYAAGRALGGPKLWPAVSPNKTWAGSMGGLLAAILVGMATAASLAPGGWGLKVALVALVLAVFTQAGDLLESWIKRHFGVKDSSGLIPGHGGLLDRLDGVLAAAPGGGRAGRGPRAWHASLEVGLGVTRRISILGSTGSIGRSTLALLAAAPEGAFAVEALVAGQDVANLAAQARAHRARLAVVADEAALPGAARGAGRLGHRGGGGGCRGDRGGGTAGGLDHGRHRGRRGAALHARGAGARRHAGPRQQGKPRLRGPSGAGCGRGLGRHAAAGG
jgi:phosphatidate cytidylyltransferase